MAKKKTVESVIMTRPISNREAFKLFWAQEKSKYGKSKDLEEILWCHLKAIKMDHPEKFEDGIAHFGFKKIV
jgi:hypothetical protein